jgi:hypothetical protein
VIIAEDAGQSSLVVGQPVGLTVDGNAAHLFDARDVAYSRAA